MTPSDLLEYSRTAQAGRRVCYHPRPMADQHFRRVADVPKGIPGSRPVCNVPDCGKPHLARGWCSAHYAQQWAAGLPPLEPPVRPETIVCGQGHEYKPKVKKSGNSIGCPVCRNEKFKEYYRRPEVHAGYRLREKIHRAAQRRQVLRAYGGVCACCGEVEEAFLTIDHVNNDGAQHRREIGRAGGSSMTGWLIQNNFPEGFQVLCWNCNAAKQYQPGGCPHQYEGGQLFQEK